MKLIPSRATLDHPNLLFTIHELNDAADEQDLEEVFNLAQFLVAVIGENEARYGSRFIDQVPLASLLGVAASSCVRSASDRKRPLT